MKILAVSYKYYPDFGGELNNCIARWESLIQRGHEVRVVCGSHPLEKRIELRNGIEIKRAAFIGRSRISRGFQRLYFHVTTTWAILNTRADVLHLAHVGGVGQVYTYLIFLWFCLLGKLKGMRTVVVNSLNESDDAPLKFDGIQHCIKRRFFKAVDVIVNVSPGLQNYCLSLGLSQSKEICYGVKEDVFKPLAECDFGDVYERYGLEKGVKYFLSIGAVGYRKGTDLMVKAINLFEDLHGEKWGLVVIGPFNKMENSDLQKNEVLEIANLAKDSTHFLGRVDDVVEVVKLINACEVFLFPSLREGFGIAPMEAMSCKKAVVVSKLPGITDVANVEGETGLYIEPGSLESLLKAMLDMAGNSEKRHSMGEKGQLRINQCFSWNKFIDDWELAYLGED